MRFVESWVRRAASDVFSALERAEPAIVRMLNPHGVIGAEYVVGLVHPFSVYVWLVTATDAERDALDSSNPLLGDVNAALLENDFPLEQGSLDGTVAQSQETVDRDYEGSGFYALR